MTHSEGEDAEWRWCWEILVYLHEIIESQHSHPFSRHDNTNIQR